MFIMDRVVPFVYLIMLFASTRTVKFKYLFSKDVN